MRAAAGPPGYAPDRQGGVKLNRQERPGRARPHC